MPALSSTESDDAPEYINALMLGFRELVIGLQDEGDQYRQKLANIKLRSRNTKTRINNLLKIASAVEEPIKETHTEVRRLPPPRPPPPQFYRKVTPSTTTTTTTTTSATLTTDSRTKAASSQHLINSDLRNLIQTHNIHNRYSTIATSSATNRYSRHIGHNRSATLSSRNMSSVAAAARTRGVLIVFEGLDRVGKSTLAQKLVEHLQKTRRDVTYCRFPDRTTHVGQLIDGFLKSSSKRYDSHVMHLLFSANRWELSKRIKNRLNEGTTVIVDRYSYSGIAYSSADKDISLKWCLEMERGLPRPDLVIYLNLPREAQYQRPGFGDERYETKEKQDLVRAQYERVMELSKETWLKVDVDNKSPDEVLGEVILPVKRCLESCSTKELGTLDFFDPADQ